MSKLSIIYGTGSHNTEWMAIAIEECAKAEGIETILKNVDLKINKLLITYGIEMIEDLLMKRMSGKEELELYRIVGTLLACNIKSKEVLCVA
jgi:flavodoxin